MNDGIKFRMCSGFWNERRLEHEAWLRFARMLGMVVEPPPSIPRHELKELFEDEIGITWYDEVGLNDGTFMPYPHYAFPRALPTELKGIAV